MGTSETIKRIIDERDRARLQAWVIGLLRLVSKLRARIAKLENTLEYIDNADWDIQVELGKALRLASWRLWIAGLSIIVNIIIAIMLLLVLR